jgi:uncharacterized small protein (TIGR04563 family)
MPIRITHALVDWGWPSRTEPERQVIQTCQPRLDEPDHTLESFSALLAAASSELPAVSIPALVDDDAGSRTLLLALAGTLTSITVVDSSGPRQLSPDHAARVRFLRDASKSSLFPVTVSAASRLAAGDTTLARAVYLPEPTLALLRSEASRLDKSLSYLVQLAWKESRARIAALPDRDAASALRPPVTTASTFKQTLLFPAAMLVELESEATRFDSSLSWLLQLAITLAAPAIAARPSA